MRNTITVAFIAFAGAALAAQPGQQAQSAERQSQRQQQSSAQAQSSGAQQGVNVTVTGCLEAGANNTFTLTAADNDNASGASQQQTGTTGTTATTPAGSKVVKTITYTLTPSGNVDLRSNVGKQVQVTGNATAPQANVKTNQQTSGAANGAEGTSGQKPTVQTTTQAQIVARQLSVSAVKKVADKCEILK